MAEELYYNDNFFEAVDLNKIIFCLIEEKQTNSYNEEEISDINQVITQLKECRIISYPFKQKSGRCGSCERLLRSDRPTCHCQNCGSYNTTVQPSKIVKYLQYMERLKAEEILADASINISNPIPFLKCLEVIEKEANFQKRFFEVFIKIRIKANVPNEWSYRCGACNFKINYDKEVIREPKFCPYCGIPFRRVRYTKQWEDGSETTEFRKPYHVLFP